MALPWRDAWDRALYGENGFYHRPEGPAGHFRTASHAAPAQLAAAIARLADRVGATKIVDVGAGRAELLTALAGHQDFLVPQELWGVDVVPRPAGLNAGIGWAQGLDDLPDAALTGALVVAWELLDVIAATLLEVGDDGHPRVLLVDPPSGRERTGPSPDPVDLAWVDRWWPAGQLQAGDRIEVGRSRDLFWGALVRRASGAGAVAALVVDYAHDLDDRPSAGGSLSAFRAGRSVPPRPDGSMDLTAHVALDSVAAAGIAAGARTLELTTQAQALRRLGVTHPELLDEGSLGGFRWLLQSLQPRPR